MEHTTEQMFEAARIAKNQEDLEELMFCHCPVMLSNEYGSEVLEHCELTLNSFLLLGITNHQIIVNFRGLFKVSSEFDVKYPNFGLDTLLDQSPFIHKRTHNIIKPPRPNATRKGALYVAELGLTQEFFPTLHRRMQVEETMSVIKGSRIYNDW